jgi:hypothetical protein
MLLKGQQAYLLRTTISILPSVLTSTTAPFLSRSVPVCDVMLEMLEMLEFRVPRFN